MCINHKYVIEKESIHCFSIIMVLLIHELIKACFFVSALTFTKAFYLVFTQLQIYIYLCISF